MYSNTVFSQLIPPVTLPVNYLKPFPLHQIYSLHSFFLILDREVSISELTEAI